MQDVIQNDMLYGIEQDYRFRRVLSLFVAVALLFAGLALASEAADAAPSNGAAVAAASAGGAALGAAGLSGAVGQINVDALIRAIVCPLLNALVSGPLGGIIGPIIQSLRVGFGCTS